MLLGYNTNGWAHHGLGDAIRLLADLGYQSIAITLDHGALNPLEDSAVQRQEISQLLQHYQLQSVIETGARYLLNPKLKHEPTLISEDQEGRRRRCDFLCRAIDTAAELGSRCVSLWSGGVHDLADDETIWSRLLSGLEIVLAHAEQRRVQLGFEPEPGMFIDTMHRYQQLTERTAAGALQLTLDVGHLHCLGEPICETIERWQRRLVNVHIEDMRRGVHDHLMFGEGEIAFPPVMASLRDAGYIGGVHVELSRHSHDAPRAAQRAYEFLRPLMGEG